MTTRTDGPDHDATEGRKDDRPPDDAGGTDQSQRNDRDDLPRPTDDDDGGPRPSDQIERNTDLPGFGGGGGGSENAGSDDSANSALAAARKDFERSIAESLYKISSSGGDDSGAARAMYEERLREIENSP